MESAARAQRLIAEQGEGIGGGIYDTETELAHYYRFQQLKLGRYYLPRDEPDAPTGPPLSVDWDAAYPMMANPKLAGYPRGSELRAAGSMSQPSDVSQPGDLLERFMAFSAGATGFRVTDLWGTGQAEDYFETVLDEAGEALLRELLEDQATAFGSAKLGPLARNIIKLWYAGTWYELPPEWAAAFGAPLKRVPAPRQAGQPGPPGRQHRGRVMREHGLADGQGVTEQQGRQRTPARVASYVVSPAAYTEGLLWRAIGAHPAGAKAPGYGSWAQPPVIDGYDAREKEGTP
jgi:hypothetical protein